MCGGTPPDCPICTAALGLSPRVRGNHHVVEYDIRTGRSIPACAGEPAWDERVQSEIKVYPRVCGGTA